MCGVGAMGEQIISTVVPPTGGRASRSGYGGTSPTAGPLPLAELALVSRDCPTVYGMGRMDASGRVAERAIVRALGWSPHDRCTISTTARSMLLRRDPHGCHQPARTSGVVLPLPARRWCGLEPGHQVLLTALPAHALLVIHTCAALDEALRPYHHSLRDGVDQ